MARLVTIGAGTKRDVNNLGDIVEKQEDGFVFGPAYATFDIVEVEGTVAQVDKELGYKDPLTHSEGTHTYGKYQYRVHNSLAATVDGACMSNITEK